MQEIKLTKQELQKISLDFRDVAGRLMRTGYEDGTSNLKRFIRYIDNEPIINQFIQQHNYYQVSIESIMNNYPEFSNPIPDESESEEISFFYQLLKYALLKYDYSNGYLDLADAFCGHSAKFQQTLDKFNCRVILPFYRHIEKYLTKLQIDIEEAETNQVIIQVQGDNYGYMNGINIDKSTSIQAGRDAVGNTSNSEVTGSVTNTVTSQQNTNSDLTDIAQAIAELRQQVSTLAANRQSIANAAIDEIEAVVDDPTLTKNVETPLWTLWGLAQGAAGFINAVTAVAERFGVHFIQS
ncbi:hypothetical protein VB713_20255 [Anabaena cylindrica UHCC 0172]|uniref:hypothetical protein n=1 Tax=Anabaena cylindrica TaxID=1165 RepID=UPI002B21C641|nr:hypothetical protein [Anabaena cylindrica]MEA5553276.1 hypothetical protein [Anabaena cylindrica UHCC 0172]